MKPVTLLALFLLASCKTSHLPCCSDSEAYEAAKGYVAEHLKAPAAAKYSEPVYDTAPDGTTIVKFNVDALNFFGVPLRSACSMNLKCEDGKPVFTSGRMGEEELPANDSASVNSEKRRQAESMRSANAMADSAAAMMDRAAEDMKRASEEMQRVGGQ